MQAHKNTSPANPFSQFSSRKLWELLQVATPGCTDAAFIQAAREELIQRGYFQPNAAWTAPH